MNIKEKIKKLFGLLELVDVHAKDPKGDTPLMDASRRNLDTAADLLIKKGADVNTTGFWGATPLMEAARNNNLELVRTLLLAGAEVNYCDEEVTNLSSPATALMQAAAVNGVEIAQLLIDNHAGINTPHPQAGMTALMYAAKKNAIETAELLLKSGANLEVKTFGMGVGRGKTALSFAVIENHKEMTELLLKKGAKAKPLRAIQRKQISADMVKWLKARGAL